MQDIEIVSVSLRPGRTTFTTPIAHPWVALVTYVASEQAEIIAFGNADQAGLRTDLARADAAAYRLAAWSGMGAAVDEGRAAAREILQLHWSDVERVALALLNAPDGALSGADIPHMSEVYA